MKTTREASDGCLPGGARPTGEGGGLPSLSVLPLAAAGAVGGLPFGAAFAATVPSRPGVGGTSSAMIYAGLLQTSAAFWCPARGQDVAHMPR